MSFGESKSPLPKTFSLSRFFPRNCHLCNFPVFFLKTSVTGHTFGKGKNTKLKAGTEKTCYGIVQSLGKERATMFGRLAEASEILRVLPRTP